MNDTSPELAQLKALHLPADITQLPVAPGWWLLLCIIVVSCYLLYKTIYRQIKKNVYRKQALQQLSKISDEYQQHQSDKTLLLDINLILKSVAIAQYPQHHCHSFSEQKWQLFLASAVSRHDQIDTQVFEKFSAIYKADIELSKLEREGLIKSCQQWLKKHHSIVHI